mmetsp:Transcript_15002/g.41233  ORF Transcript_15002/g.41233 Transcript_15002/m.41233 type:complete len:250 (-) Transcript_15002:426-1175(-)
MVCRVLEVLRSHALIVGALATLVHGEGVLLLRGLHVLPRHTIIPHQLGVRAVDAMVCPGSVTHAEVALEGTWQGVIDDAPVEGAPLLAALPQTAASCSGLGRPPVSCSLWRQLVSRETRLFQRLELRDGGGGGAGEIQQAPNVVNGDRDILDDRVDGAPHLHRVFPQCDETLAAFGLRRRARGKKLAHLLQVAAVDVHLRDGLRGQAAGVRQKLPQVELHRAGPVLRLQVLHSEVQPMCLLRNLQRSRE